MTDSHDLGLKTRREVMGDAFVDRALGNATEFTAPLQEFVNAHAWAGCGPAKACRARPAA
ncbi:hypothetical protein D3C80_980340 [compost metagenome]